MQHFIAHHLPKQLIKVVQRQVFDTTRDLVDRYRFFRANEIAYALFDARIVGCKTHIAIKARPGVEPGWGV